MSGFLGFPSFAPGGRSAPSGRPSAHLQRLERLLQRRAVQRSAVDRPSSRIGRSDDRGPPTTESVARPPQGAAVSGPSPAVTVPTTRPAVAGGLSTPVAASPSNFAPPTSQPSLSASRVETSTFAGSQEGSIVIRTAEGDTVEINFASALETSSSFAAVALQDDNGSSFAVSTSSSYSLSESLSFSVAGDLSEKELGAIGKLLKDVTKVADKFFGGNIEAAFDKAQKLGDDIDEEVISGATFDFSASYEVSRYQAVSLAASGPELSDPLAAAADLLRDELDGLRDGAKDLRAFPEGEEGRNLSALLTGVARAVQNDHHPLLGIGVEYLLESDADSGDSEVDGEAVAEEPSHDSNAPAPQHVDSRKLVDAAIRRLGGRKFIDPPAGPAPLVTRDVEVVA